MKEISKVTVSGWLMTPILVVLVLLTGYAGVITIQSLQVSVSFLPILMVVLLVIALIIEVLCFGGLYTLEPNESAVLNLFGKYAGTDRTDGFKWVNPLFEKRKISLRARNFINDKLKVNDLKGNPIEISAVVVWKVKDTAQAVFDVDSYHSYVEIQTDSAIRHIASQYPYDTTEGDTLSLRASISEVSDALGKEIQERVKTAGVDILEARINHLAYAPEIAGAMLQRQQAEAIISARQKIVEGAVGMVQMALEKLKNDNILELDDERKAHMVSNLLVVLCADKSTQPVVNTGTIY